MKKLMKGIIFNILSLYILSMLFTGVKATDDISSLIISGLILFILMLIIKPILTLITFPLTLITFGIYGLVSNIINTMIIFYLLTKIDSHVTIYPFTVQRMQITSLILPKTSLNGFFAFAVVSVVYLVMKGVFSWIIQE